MVVHTLLLHEPTTQASERMWEHNSQLFLLCHSISMNRIVQLTHIWIGRWDKSCECWFYRWNLYSIFKYMKVIFITLFSCVSWGRAGHSTEHWLSLWMFYILALHYWWAFYKPYWDPNSLDKNIPLCHPLRSQGFQFKSMFIIEKSALASSPMLWSRGGPLVPPLPKPLVTSLSIEVFKD